MHPFSQAGFSSASSQWYAHASTNNARTAAHPQQRQPSHGPLPVSFSQGASTVPYNLGPSSSLHGSYVQPVNQPTTSNRRPTRISSPVIPPPPEHFMSPTPSSIPLTATSSQAVSSSSTRVSSQHRAIQEDTPVDSALMTPMLRIAVFTGQGEGALSGQTPVWALFINYDPEYKERVDLLTIRKGSSRHSWEPASAVKVSLRKRKDLVCVIELPPCSWAPNILFGAIDKSQRLPQTPIPWSSAHWVCYTIENLGTLADPAMCPPPFYWTQQLIVYDLWTTVWNAAIVHFADRYLADRAGNTSQGQSGLQFSFKLTRIEANKVRLHMFPEPTDVTQELRSARTVLRTLKGAPDRSKNLTFTFDYAVSRLGV